MAAWLSFLCFQKKVHKKNMQICLSNLLPGLRVKSKFQTVTFFSVINHGRDSIGGTFTANVSLIPPVLTKIHSHCKSLRSFTVSN